MSSSTESSALFAPLQVGPVTLSHRIVLAPLTRSRATKDHVHTKLGVDYYSQRSSIPGSLLITEASTIHPAAGANHHTPHIYTDAQVQAWKKVVDAVHANGSYIFLQLWAFGRATDLELLKAEDPNFELVGPSAIPISPSDPVPRPLTVEEIKTYVQWYAIAANKAVNEAGFDGVELHFANGYLPDQFLQDVSNQRTDEYGGSVENRTRFPLEIIEAVANVVGEDRVGFRISPWNSWQGMRMEDPKPTFAYLASQTKDRFPNLAYLHAVEPRVSGIEDVDGGLDSNEFLRKIWGDKVFIAAGGYTPQTAAETVSTLGGLVAFGRHYIANPDLPLRIKYGVPLTRYQRSTFYTFEDPHGYTDYPAATLSQLTGASAIVTPVPRDTVNTTTLVPAA